MMKPTMLYVSPFWPQRSGISEYSETLVWGDAEYFSEADGNVFAILRHPFDSKEGKSYMAICDRFGRGVDFINEKLKLILEKVDNFKERSYIIEKVAGGYGMLVSLN